MTGRRTTAAISRPQSTRRTGATATELALCLPLVMTLVFGAVDFGRVFATSMTLSNAVRVGAEQGATHRLTALNRDAWESRIQAAIIEELQDVPHFDLAQLAISIEPVEEGDGRLRVEVSASYPFRPIVDWPLLPGTIPLSCRVSIEQYR